MDETRTQSTNTRKHQVVAKSFLVKTRAKRPLFARKVWWLFLILVCVQNLALKAPAPASVMPRELVVDASCVGFNDARVPAVALVE
jgi:hypothetical protein